MSTVVVPRIAGAVAYDPTAVAITGGASQWSDGTVGAPSISFASTPSNGFYVASSVTNYSAGGAYQLDFNAGGLAFRPAGGLFWRSGNAASNGADTSLMRQSAGLVVVDGTTATPAGGSTSLGLVFGSTAGFGIYIGSGAPTLSAAQGSIYLRSDGSSTSTRLYVNTNGSTGWTNVTTAA
jgi:hypothetical protein